MPTLFTFEVPDDVRHVTVSYELPATAGTRAQPVSLLPPAAPPAPETDEAAFDPADNWREGKTTWLQEDWTDPADIREIVAGCKEKMQSWLRFLAERPGQTFKMSDICEVIGVPSSSIRGGLSGVGKRMGHMGHKRSFFDTRWSFDGSGEMEYRMRAREARIVMAWFSHVEGQQEA